MHPAPTEADLRAVVHGFYARVRQDPELGPLFADAVADWDEHLQRLTDFWTSLMPGSGRYRGDPASVHLAHAARVSPALFQRWLALWRRSSDERLPAAQARAVQERAARIADHLQRVLAARAPAVSDQESTP